MNPPSWASTFSLSSPGPMPGPDPSAWQAPPSLPQPGLPVPGGWTRPPVAWPVGQTDDLVMPAPDGGRWHWQQFPDGTASWHFDQYDPAAGASDAVAHLATETPAGPIVAGLVLAGLVVWAVSRARA